MEILSQFADKPPSYFVSSQTSELGPFSQASLSGFTTSSCLFVLGKSYNVHALVVINSKTRVLFSYLSSRQDLFISASEVVIALQI